MTTDDESYPPMTRAQSLAYRADFEDALSDLSYLGWNAGPAERPPPGPRRRISVAWWALGIPVALILVLLSTLV